MKKMFMSAMGLALMAGFGTSCSDDNPFGRNGVKVQFTVNMEGEEVSRSFSDGKSANQLIFAVYNADAEELTQLRQEDIQIEGLKATVKTQVVKGKKYDFVFWAQEKGTNVFDTDDMRAIKINYNELTKVCNNENLDAFYNVINDLHVSGPVEMDVELKRPFAQINFATSKADWKAAQKSGVGEDNVVKSQMTVSGGVFSVLNTRDGSVSGKIEEPLEFTFATIPADDNTWLPRVDALDANGNPGQDGVYEDYRWLGMTYVLVDETQMANEVKLDISSPTVNTNLPVGNVPMKRNYRTNIVGNLLTSGAIFNVTVSHIYDADHNYPSTVEEEIIMAAGNSGTVVLSEDVTLTKRVNVTKDMVIDLNGKTISMNAPNSKDYNILFNVTNGATLTIKGEGNVQALGGHSIDMAIYANGGNAIIEGGNFYGVGIEGEGCDLIYVRNAKVQVKGGTFKMEHANPLDFSATQYSLLNVSGATVANAKDYIVVTGGKFYNFNPADNVSEGEGTNFVADGCTVTEEDGWYIVK